MQQNEARKPRQTAARAGKPPTVDRLRRDIDSGVTGEKVDHPDPAAAPMGTDDEAAGAPPSALQRRMEQNARPESEVQREGSGRAASFYLGAAFVAGVLLIAMAILLG